MNDLSNILLEGRVEDAHAWLESNTEYYELNNWVIQELSDNDPSGSNKYLIWAIKKYFDESLNTTLNNSLDVNQLIELLNNFHKNLQRLEKKDINSYNNIDELKTVVDEVMSIKTRSELKSEVDKIYEDDDWLVVYPKTHQSSCYYGAGTKWCTTTKNSPKAFNNYQTSGSLYYIIKKNDGDFKLALHRRYPTSDHNLSTSEDSMFDMEDRRLDMETVNVVMGMLPSKARSEIENSYLQNFNDLETESPLTLNEFAELLTEKLEGTRLKLSTESGFWVLHTPSRDGWYVESVGENPIRVDIDLFTNNLYEIGVVTILNNLLLDYVIVTGGIANKRGLPINNSLINFSSGLVDYEYFSSRFLEPENYRGNHYVGWPEVKFVEQFLFPNLRAILNTSKVKVAVNKNVVLWDTKRGRTSIKFRYPPKKGSLTQLFVDFIKNNPGKTKMEFYNHIGRTHTPGHNSEFFSVINSSGIVEMVRQGRQFVYKLGPNYDKWISGKLNKQ
jgi:hypothetical protein